VRGRPPPRRPPGRAAPAMARAHAPCHRHAATMAQLSVLVAVVSAVAARRTIRPGVPWFDTDGNLLDAHGAGMLEHEGQVLLVRLTQDCERHRHPDGRWHRAILFDRPLFVEV